MLRAVYILLDPRDDAVKYVGCCLEIRVRARLAKHYNPDYNPGLIAWAANLKGLGLRPKQVVVEMGIGDDWEDREKYWIKQYRRLGCSLLNLTDGGQGPLGSKKSLATKLKHRAYRHTDDARRRIRAAHLGTKFTKQHRTAISLAKKGKPFTERQRVAMFAAIAKNPKCRARYRKGESNGNAVLDESSVKAIRRMHGKLSLSKLAAKFGVGVSAIKRVINRRTWSHL